MLEAVHLLVATWSWGSCMIEGTVASGDKRGKYSHNSAVATCCGLTSSSNWAHPNPKKLGGKWGAKVRAQGQGESDILNSLESKPNVYKSAGKALSFCIKNTAGSVSCVDSCFWKMGWLNTVGPQGVTFSYRKKKCRICSTLSHITVFQRQSLLASTALKSLCADPSTAVWRPYLTFLGGFNNIR